MFLVELFYRNGQRDYLPASFTKRRDARKMVLWLASTSQCYAHIAIVELTPEGQTIH